MPPRTKTTGLLLLVVLAGVGFAMIFLTTLVVDRYQTVAEYGAAWATVYLIVVGVGAALLFGSTLWIVVRLWRSSRRKRRRREQRKKDPSQLTAAQQAAEVDRNLASVADLQADASVDPQLREQLDPLVDRIEQKRERRQLEIVAFGTISSGKSSLLNALAGRDVFQTDARGGTTLRRNEIPWPGDDQVVLVDTPGLGEVDAAERQATAAEAARDADLVLLVVDGPVRQSEITLLETLGQMEKRVVVCLNKLDWYDARQRADLLGQIAGQVEQHVPADDVVAVRSRPIEHPRVRVAADGSETTEPVAEPADIEPLARRMMQIVRADGRDLLLANLLLQSRGLVDEARRRVQARLDERAWQIVDRHMWGAGGAAALSPLPVVDLAAGAAVSTKMVLDLARVYRQDVDLDVAVNLLGQQGKNLLSVLGASAATPVVSSAVASLLKTVPGVGTIAGGLLQGVVQVLVTRWIGAVFIEYFRNEMRQPPGGMVELARQQWEKMTSAAELRRLVEAARERLVEDDDA